MSRFNLWTISEDLSSQGLDMTPNVIMTLGLRGLATKTQLQNVLQPHLF